MRLSLTAFQFPITALREIKLLKLLSHPNILKLEDMAVEYPAAKISKSTFSKEVVPQPCANTLSSRQAEEAYYVYGHTIHGPRSVGSA